jgi:hypothetical protein
MRPKSWETAMNNKFGRDDRYSNERYRDRRDDRLSEDRFGEDRWLRSPDQEFETSGPYRQPHGEGWNRAPRYGGSDYGRSGYGSDYGRFGSGSGGYDSARGYYGSQGYGPSPYVPGAPPRGGFSGRGPKGYTRTDDRIKEDVCDRLSWNDEVDATEITVRVQDGEVTLEGRVETRHMKRLAGDIAEEVSGVKDVHNTIRVTKPILTELKEKITGEAREEHYANTGTKTTGASGARNGIT